MRHLLDIVDLSEQEIYSLIEKAQDIMQRPTKYQDVLRYRKVATLFFEPSTRTRLSFEAAAMELGANVIGFQSAAASSTAKGESIGDTVRTVSNYADIIVMRHPVEGAPYAAVLDSEVPIINAGDGGHNHPTQTLADLLTIYRRKETFDGLTIGVCGDLKYGRTVHSLLRAMSRYQNVRFVCISPKELRLPEYMTEFLRDKRIDYTETVDMEEYMSELDVLYMTRVQRERFDDKNEYERLKDSYILSESKLTTARADMCILHPLPRVNEIAKEVDMDKRAAYFEQVKNGKYMRMALILFLLDHRNDPTQFVSLDHTADRCRNPKCILQFESALPGLTRTIGTKKRCYYCESLI
ncbi:MAG: aspartate carbamoyltransferase [Clostridia bacterium]|nr:aspartate carbamoyltransferase [Clostridia bacterium]